MRNGDIPGVKEGQVAWNGFHSFEWVALEHLRMI
jgi:hypothetical protein